MNISLSLKVSFLVKDGFEGIFLDEGSWATAEKLRKESKTSKGYRAEIWKRTKSLDNFVQML